MTAAQRDQWDLQVARRNRDDLSVLLELRDIEDELSTILKLLDQQDTVLKSMMTYFDVKGCGKVFLDAAQVRIDEYRTQLGEMKENSHLAQKAVCTISYLSGDCSFLTVPCPRWKLFLISNRSKPMSTKLRWRGGRLRQPRTSRDR